ncbi:hypothetical protein Amsp01_061700 [Amycolatopsis sp. NBRC 101858]|uniref:DUF3592 domain-containing protein n=1 Tax=Amycolatopsis sp. NBRC 101858 TaxID=3032200 RepID=UPI0024A36445|nr:DUF3592 domain-containing protein [Amycolatopsis sp. NBRC 101858]GLY40147.1 hypothetical protein Amsp01_061700 [Amycolatopsis sp. NBRC 101858]
MGKVGLREQAEDPAAPGVRRLRAGGWRWTFALFVAVAMVVGGVALAVLVDRAADELLRTGARADGTIEAVHELRNGSLLDIRYPLAGRSRTTTIQANSGRYAAGDHVTVVVDPARPARVRTVEEPNEDPRVLAAAVALLVVGGVTLPIAVLRRIRWAKRLAAARRTGWCPAVVTVVPDRRLAAKNHHAPDLEIRYDDGTTATARGAHAFGVAALGDRPRRPAWVAGYGPNLSVLFREGPGGGPFLVPATERASR